MSQRLLAGALESGREFLCCRYGAIQLRKDIFYEMQLVVPPANAR
jgi:hypothetical protein